MGVSLSVWHFWIQGWQGCSIRQGRVEGAGVKDLVVVQPR